MLPVWLIDLMSFLGLVSAGLAGWGWSTRNDGRIGDE